MLNREKHQLIMGRVLKDIYSDITISPLLGFKGGTCAYFFYNLPRFSVDLDFDLLVVNEENQVIVLKKIVDILSKYGEVKDQWIKGVTIFALLSYGEDDQNIKIEINVRKLVKNIKDHYEIKEYLGISMFVAKKDYLFASKLSALTQRNETASRDIYDIHYFAKSNWDINEGVIKDRTAKATKEYLADCIAFIEKVKDNQILHGLGELVDSEKEKAWIRNHLKADSIFMLKNYMSVMK
ncbi:MAG: nucleotidyl transferase AbiEii/AbiGii toxin family protein [Patescibacteria group bacterium]|jgi:predicted nucleotidyltransferase component of viral defense system|nr:nucleotidyl transferase AbiEii/AbiGii toxin family protein [Patescibacteria group bacterium]